MKITILTAVFHPEIHPRAFRAYELAKSFAQQGHDVEVVLLTRVTDFDYAALENKYNIRIRQVGIYTTASGNNNRQTFQSTNRVLGWIYKAYRFLLEYLLAGNLFPYAFRIAKALEEHCSTHQPQLLIALSTPFMDFLGAAIYRSRKKKQAAHTIFVADSGDPFYYSQQTPRAFYFKWTERWVYKHFDYLTIPTDLARDAYRGLLPQEKIRIIPQAFDFDAVPLPSYSPQAERPAIFAYAGVFYSDIRNPEFLLQYLATRKEPFCFKVYLRHIDPAISALLTHYQKALGKQLQVHYGIKREQLLQELATCDFLLNIGNTTATQLPSKLIDYGITQRPVYSTVAADFDPVVFEAFLHGDYSHAMHIDIAPYDIRRVTKQLIDLTAP